MEDLENYSQHAYEFIAEIEDQFGPRFACTEQEKQANFWVKDKWSRFCDEIKREEFLTRPNLLPQGLFKVMLLFGILAFLPNVLIYPYSVLASIISFSALLVVFFEGGLEKGILKFFFKEKKSSNVYGIIKPKREVKFRVILDGHIDSAKEIRWVRTLRPRMAFSLIGLVFVYYFVNVIYPIVKLLLQAFGNITTMVQFSIFEITILDVYFLPFNFILLIIFIIAFVGMISNKVVIGANDNLSGTSVASAVGLYFSKHKLDNIELVILSAGAEEVGEKGAEYFVKSHPELLENSYSVVLECVGAGTNLLIVEFDLMHISNYSPEVIERLKKACEIYQSKQNPSFTFRSGKLALGSADATKYVAEGYKSTFVIMEGQRSVKPVNWHSANDTVENIDQQVLQDAIGVIINFVKIVDDEYQS